MQFSTWILVWLGTLPIAGLWMCYLIKVVMNDEELQDRIRRIRRQQEEEIRAEQDKLLKSEQMQKEMNAAARRMAALKQPDNSAS